MKPPPIPQNSLDDQIAAALHGDLTPEERTQFESRLQTDPNAQAAYQEAKAMHELLEQTNKSAQPDPDFEQRMVSGVRRKLTHPPHQETAWESLIMLWTGTRAFFARKRAPVLGPQPVLGFLAVLAVIAVLAGVALGPITNGIKKAKQSSEVQMGHEIAMADYQAQADAGVPITVPTGVEYKPEDGKPEGGRIVEVGEVNGVKKEIDITERVKEFAKTGVLPVGRDVTTHQIMLGGANTYTGGISTTAGTITSGTTAVDSSPVIVSASATLSGSGGLAPAHAAMEKSLEGKLVDNTETASAAQWQQQSTFAPVAPMGAPAATLAPSVPAQSVAVTDQLVSRNADLPQTKMAFESADKDGQATGSAAALKKVPAPKPIAATTATPAPADTRKLIRNGQLDLEVKSYQAAVDQVSALTKLAGGYVDTSNSQRGGNGKLQGTVVVKILPENLDAFMLKLRDLGQVQNQSVSTEDVTKEYFDTQARLVNSQKMELQLQDLLKRENGKVSDLLAVERELGRVRGDIEQMQGQLKLYDFQVEYATVTMNIAEKDLNQTAAYLLKEQDNFALFATDVEGAFKKARAVADQFNAQVLSANLEHDVSSDNNQVGASLVVMVAPDQIEPFLTQVRGLGRVANFTRQTQRVAKDGGDSSQPADETKTEKDKVRVQLSIRSDDDSRKQVAITVVTKDVNEALDQAKAAALANEGTEILGSALNTSPQGASTAQLNVRVPGKEYTTLMDSFRALGRSASLSIQRNDNAGPGASGDDVPVIVTLALTDNDAPVQETNLVLSANDVDAQAQQIKKQAGDAGVEIKSSSFERQPDGTELAQMTLRLPLGHYPAFLATLQQAGKTESLSVQRSDRPDQTRPDDSAPAEIQLQLHNLPAIVPDNGGLFATLRDTFAQGFGALFGSVKVIGVIVAFLIPWAVAVIVAAWIGRRIYLWRKNR
jgi:hypothetical protein